MFQQLAAVLGDLRFWHDNMPLFFCGGMILCFLAWAQAYLRPVRRTGLAVQWLADRPFWGEETVGVDERRLKAGELVRECGDPRLEQVFELFKSQWKRHAAIIDGRETSTVDVADVITPEGLMPERFAAWFAPSIPGFFTGMGLLGTVVGLVLGLKGVGFGSGMGSGASFVGSVASLLAGMYSAFTASIAGIGLSLAWNALDGACRGRLDQAIEHFHRAVRAVYPVRSQSDLLLALLHRAQGSDQATMESLKVQLAALAQGQQTALDKFVSEALVAYKLKMQTVTGQLQTMLEDADDAMKELRTTLQRVNERGREAAPQAEQVARPRGLAK